MQLSFIKTSLSCVDLVIVYKFPPLTDHTFYDSYMLKIVYWKGLFGNIYQCKRFGTVHFLEFCPICFQGLLSLENYFSWLVKLKKVTFPHPVITSYKKEPNVKLWYITCQSRNVKDNLMLVLFRTNAMYVLLHLNTEGQLKKWGLVQITHYVVLSLF